MIKTGLWNIGRFFSEEHQNGIALGQRAAIAELQQRNLPSRIHRKIRLRLRLAFDNINRHMSIIHAEIRQQQADLIGIAGREIIIELHALCVRRETSQSLPPAPRSCFASVCFSFVCFPINGDVREGGQAPVELEIKLCFRAVPSLRPASLSDRKVPRDDAFLHYRPSYAVEA